MKKVGMFISDVKKIIILRVKAKRISGKTAVFGKSGVSAAVSSQSHIAPLYSNCHAKFQ